MRKWFIVLGSILLLLVVFVFGVLGYDSYEDGWLYNSKAAAMYKRQRLMLIEIREHKAKKLHWSKDKIDTFIQLKVDSLDKKYWKRKGIYIGL